MRFWGILCLVATCLAQPATVGVRAGVRINNEITGGASSESKRYLVGPMAEVRLPHRFSFEVDALYSRFGYSTQVTTSLLRDPLTKQLLTNVFTERVRANSWEFPLLAKYRFEAAFHLLAGYAPRRITGSFHDTGYFEINSAGGPAPLDVSGATSFRVNHAAVFGLGTVWSVGPVRFEPELRYLRWKNAWGPSSFDPASSVSGARNEVQFLLGIGWSGR